jgi:hypothetical protein
MLGMFFFFIVLLEQLFIKMFLVLKYIKIIFFIYILKFIFNTSIPKSFINHALKSYKEWILNSKGQNPVLCLPPTEIATIAKWDSWTGCRSL